jgi:hypothetical protein
MYEESLQNREGIEVLLDKIDCSSVDIKNAECLIGE